jgi:hypothetical protein
MPDVVPDNPELLLDCKTVRALATASRMGRHRVTCDPQQHHCRDRRALDLRKHAPGILRPLSCLGGAVVAPAFYLRPITKTNRSFTIAA